MTLDELVAGLRDAKSLDPDTRADLAAALKRIPVRYARLLLMHYQEGYGMREAMRQTATRSWRDWQRATEALLKEMNHE